LAYRLATLIDTNVHDLVTAVRSNIEAMAEARFSYLVSGWPTEGRDRVETFVADVMADYAG
jgi:hypothetical protein